jgi:hypothetical protein
MIPAGLAALTQILRTESDLHAEFLVALNTKRQAIIAGDIAAMEKTLATEYTIVEKIREQEELRRAATAALTPAGATAPKNLTALLEKFPADETLELRAAQTRLREQLLQLRLKTRQVAELLKASLEHVTGFLQIVGEVGAGKIYNREGKITPCGAQFINRSA